MAASNDRRRNGSASPLRPARSPVVEYRVEQLVSILGDRLTAMQAGVAPGARARVRGRTVPRTVPESGGGRGGAIREVAEVVGGVAGAASQGL